MTINDISNLIINSAINVHRELGPGLFESVYQSCLIIELEEQQLKVKKEVDLPVIYREVVVNEHGFRLDLLVEDKVVIELKSVVKVSPVHIKQLLTYLKLSNKPLGLLINFNENLLKDGVRRVVNNL